MPILAAEIHRTADVSRLSAIAIALRGISLAETRPASLQIWRKGFGFDARLRDTKRRRTIPPRASSRRYVSLATCSRFPETGRSFSRSYLSSARDVSFYPVFMESEQYRLTRHRRLPLIFLVRSPSSRVESPTRSVLERTRSRRGASVEAPEDGNAIKSMAAREKKRFRRHESTNQGGIGLSSLASRPPTYYRGSHVGAQRAIIVFPPGAGRGGGKRAWE